jgi:hypothetical protein
VRRQIAQEAEEVGVEVAGAAGHGATIHPL